MNQDDTWHGGRPQPRRRCVRREPSPPPQKGGGAPSPIFGPFLLRPNGWMHQGATWHGGRPQPRGLSVRWGPSPLYKKGRSPQFSTHVYCDQTAAWIDATWYGGRPRPRRDCVRWRPSFPLPKKGRSPLSNFRPMSIVAKRLDGSR